MSTSCQFVESLHTLGDAGLALTYAGFTIGSNVLWGGYDGAVALQPTAIAWLVGAQYVLGPLALGVSYYNYQSQGSAAMVGKSQRYDDGFVAGINTLTFTSAPWATSAPTRCHSTRSAPWRKSASLSRWPWRGSVYHPM
jgi:predicted porin